MRHSKRRPLGLTLLVTLALGLLAACPSTGKKPGGTPGIGNTPPTVTSTVPMQGGTMAGSTSSGIEVTFSTEMNASSFEGGAFQVLSSGVPVAGSIRVGDSPKKMLYVFHDPMVTGQTYTVKLQGVTSTANLQLASYQTTVVGL